MAESSFSEFCQTIKNTVFAKHDKTRYACIFYNESSILIISLVIPIKHLKKELTLHLNKVS